MGRAALFLVLLAWPCEHVYAQTPNARVTVRAQATDGAPIEGAAVTSGNIRSATDGSGIAHLVLTPGPHTIRIVRLGFAPDSLHIELSTAADTTLTVVLQETSVEVEPVVVTSTRT